MASVVARRLGSTSRHSLRRIAVSPPKSSSLQARSAFTASRYVANGPAASASANAAKPASPTQEPASSVGDNGALEGPLPHFVGSDGATDWSRSYHGLSTQAFSPEVSEILMAPIVPEDVEIKPDGLLYLPEIKYRRILNKAFGPGGWGLAPRSETSVGPKIVSREYALVCQGRLVAIARGEQEYFDPSGIATATEGCKSNALMRCCKDLGIASELWDPRFIREFKAKECVEVSGLTNENPRVAIGSGVLEDRAGETILGCMERRLYRIPPSDDSHPKFSWVFDVRDRVVRTDAMFRLGRPLCPFLGPMLDWKRGLRIDSEEARRPERSSLTFAVFP
ncbi:hypothetical protein NMY22_g19783 [Coprinellus aureogranulatus]|nr:hypothetical protein NMY22_g19783 [Coprinellus aureogranulatus]